MSALAQRKSSTIALQGMEVSGRSDTENAGRRVPGARVIVPLEGLRKRSATVRIPPRPVRARVQVSPAPVRLRATPSPSLAVGYSQMEGPLGPLPAPDTSHLTVNRTPAKPKPQQLSTGSPKLRLQHAPTTSGARMLRRPLNALPKPHQKLLIVLHVLPWLLLLVVASRVLPTPLFFENWPSMVRTWATTGFGLYVLADTCFVIWHVAFRQGGRQLDGI